MTKYLTTFNELKCHIDKKVKINWYNFETKRFENEIGFLEKYKFERHYFIKCNDFKFAGIIPSCVNSIELIEEDNQEELKNKFTDEAWILEEQEKKDNINHPSHYQGKIECIDYLQDKLTVEEFKGFLKGNVIKYLSRAGKKDDELEDYKKGKWYLEKLITTMEK